MEAFAGETREGEGRGGDASGSGLHQESIHQGVGGTVSPHSTQIGKSTDGQLVAISVPRYSSLRTENPALQYQ